MVEHVYALDHRCQPRRVVGVGTIGIRYGTVWTVCHKVVWYRLPVRPDKILAALCRHDLRYGEPVAFDGIFADVERGLLLAEEISGRGYAVAQRQRPHLQRVVLEDDAVGRGVYLVPLWLVRQRRVEVPEMRLEYLAEGPRSIYRQRRALAVEPERRDQRQQPVDMVAMQVRDEYRPQLQGVDPRTHELLLHTLARIHQIVLLVYVHRLRRGVTVGRRLGRR